MALSMIPSFRKKLNLFIGLAPSTTPYGLINSFIATCARATPELIYLVFGRRSLLPSVYFYQSVLSPAMFSSVIDTSVNVLFHWNGRNMKLRTKAAAYQHLYSLCSVKVMVHWFQIIKEGRFQMYDDVGSVKSKIFAKDPIFGEIKSSGSQSNLSLNGDSDISIPNGYIAYEEHDSSFLVGLGPETLKARTSRKSATTVPISLPHPIVSQVPARYPTEQIEYNPNEDSSGPPIALFYGGSDSLLDMHAILKGLRFPWEKISLKLSAFKKQQSTDESQQTGFVLYDSKKENSISESTSPLVFLKCIPGYEHLCFLWADSLNKEVFNDVKKLLNTYSADH
jgi:hypothetical protein